MALILSSTSPNGGCHGSDQYMVDFSIEKDTPASTSVLRQ